MKAVRLHGYGDSGELRLEDTSNPELKPGQVLIKIAASGLNPIDWKLRAGLFKEWMPLAFPAIIGGDFSGTVIEVGDGVYQFSAGDRVMGMVDPANNGTYAELIAVDPASLAKVPPGLDLVDAATLPMAVLTGSQLVEQGLSPKPGDRILVTGAAGGVGQAAVQAALDAGAEVVGAVRRGGSLPEKDRIKLITLDDAAGLDASGPFDGIADTVGGAAVEGLFQHLKPDGKFASVVFPPPTAPAAHPAHVETVVVSFDRARLEKFAQAVAAGTARYPTVERFSFSQAPEAHDKLAAGGIGGKLALLPDI